MAMYIYGIYMAHVWIRDRTFLGWFLVVLEPNTDRDPKKKQQQDCIGRHRTSLRVGLIIMLSVTRRRRIALHDFL